MTVNPRSFDEPLPPSSKAATLYLVLIIGLVLALLATIVGVIYLATLDKPAPGELIALAGVCAGGLVGPLAASSKS
jgi:hypothetical protein